jgi:hypothetical protein
MVARKSPFVGLLVEPGPLLAEFRAERLGAFGGPVDPSDSLVGLGFKSDFDRSGIHIPQGERADLEAEVADGIQALDLVGQTIMVPDGAQLYFGRETVNLRVGHALPIRRTYRQASHILGQQLTVKPRRGNPAPVAVRSDPHVMRNYRELPPLPRGLSFTIVGQKVSF